MVSFLDHPGAVDFIRPTLGDLIRLYLKLIDEVDFDELIEALRKIVETYEEEVGPYAKELCAKLGEAFIRMLKSAQDYQHGEVGLEVEGADGEACLAYGGIMTAIRRICQSVSGLQAKPAFAQLYAELEEILDEPLRLALHDREEVACEDGILCFSELVYNRKEISPRMWQHFHELVTSILHDQGPLYEYMPQLFVPLLNFMKYDPVNFRSMDMGNGVTPMQLTCQLAAKAFELAEGNNCEIDAMSAVSLINGLLENLQNCQDLIPHIIDMYLQQLPQAETAGYRMMLTQGILVCLYHDAACTIAKLDSCADATEKFFQLAFSQVQDIKEDFEVKKFMLGLSALCTPGIPESVQGHIAKVMQCLSYLSQRSIEIRTEGAKVYEKDEENQLDNEAIVEDEEDHVEIGEESGDSVDDDWSGEGEDDLENDDGVNLYSSPIDELDEVEEMSKMFAGLQQ